MRPRSGPGERVAAVVALPYHLGVFYLSLAALVWFVQGDSGWRRAVYLLATPLPWLLLGGVLIARARREGPSWDAWGRPAAPERRVPAPLRRADGRILFLLPALAAAWSAGLGLLHWPVAIYGALVLVAAHFGAEPRRRSPSAPLVYSTDGRWWTGIRLWTVGVAGFLVVAATMWAPARQALVAAAVFGVVVGAISVVTAVRDPTDEEGDGSPPGGPSRPDVFDFVGHGDRAFAGGRVARLLEDLGKRYPDGDRLAEGIANGGVGRHDHLVALNGARYRVRAVAGRSGHRPEVVVRVGGPWPGTGVSGRLVTRADGATEVELPERLPRARAAPG